MQHLYLLLSFLFLPFFALAQPSCEDGESSVLISVFTDNYGYEVSWSVTGSEGAIYGSVAENTYGNNTLYETQVCVPADDCVSFTINDTFGDGICCGFGQGYYTVVVEGDTIAVGGDYGSGESTQFNCAPGQACTSPDPVMIDSIYNTTFDNHWYLFEPDSVGIYRVSTCDLNDCHTKIWIYDTCEGNGFAEDNAGTIFYDDGQGGCDTSAVITAFFEPGEVYLIRVGDQMDACAESVAWQISYQGPVTGCMDSNSCNYNPLATIDDGSCIPQGSPDCPDAPDLLMREDILVNSIYVDQVEADDECLIEEGCLQGYGTRDVIRFSTQIENIGELDYFIGEPSFDNTQFTWNNCHNHFHYDGYAEYILFEEDGTEIPIGFKNGFCVIDLGCTTGSAQYGCGNMGISAGCYDLYWAELECQWVDVTDIADGRYVFVTRVNWDNAPDKLGRLEKDTLNNWAQACIILDRSSGQLEVSLDTECDPYVDCEGTPYGNVRTDCEGTCGGTRVMGDLDQNGTQEMVDAEAYVTRMLAHDIVPTSCNDLNADEKITVYDAALLASCLNYGALHQHNGEGLHDHCNFPDGTININDTTTLSIIDANFEEQYIDIGLKNPSAFVNAYQFRMEGISITSVESLVDATSYPVTPYNNIMEGMVVGISYQDSMIFRSNEVQPICRIHYNALTTEDFICIAGIVDIINQNMEQTVTVLEDECIAVIIDNVDQPLAGHPVKVIPNPFTDQARIVFHNPDMLEHQLEILDWNGRVVQRYGNIRSNAVTVERGDLPSGVYIYRLSNKNEQVHGKMSVQ
jgi:hypothetical protein